MSGRAAWAVGLLIAVACQARAATDGRSVGPDPCGVGVSVFGPDGERFATLDVSIADVLDWTKGSASGTWTAAVADGPGPPLAQRLLRAGEHARQPAGADLWHSPDGDAAVALSKALAYERGAIWLWVPASGDGRSGTWVAETPDGEVEEGQWTSERPVFYTPAALESGFEGQEGDASGGRGVGPCARSARFYDAAGGALAEVRFLPSDLPTWDGKGSVVGVWEAAAAEPAGSDVAPAAWRLLRGADRALPLRAFPTPAIAETPWISLSMGTANTTENIALYVDPGSGGRSGTWSVMVTLGEYETGTWTSDVSLLTPPRPE